VHHSGKNEAAGARGHSSLLGALDAEMEVVKLSPEESEDRIGQFTVTKQKDGEDGFKICYRMAQVPISMVGEKKSLVVEVIDEAEAEGLREGKRRPLSAQQKLVLDALQKAIDEAGEKSKSDRIPRDVSVVKISLWRQFFYSMHPGEADTKQKAFKRSSEALISNRTCGVWGEYAWIAEAYSKTGHAGHSRTPDKLSPDGQGHHPLGDVRCPAVVDDVVLGGF
jgi:hypothetical protein